MNAHVTAADTESQPANPLTIVALQNEAALRALQAAGPQRTAAACSHISGQNPKRSEEHTSNSSHCTGHRMPSSA